MNDQVNKQQVSNLQLQLRAMQAQGDAAKQMVNELNVAVHQLKTNFILVDQDRNDLLKTNQALHAANKALQEELDNLKNPPNAPQEPELAVVPPMPVD